MEPPLPRSVTRSMILLKRLLPAALCCALPLGIAQADGFFVEGDELLLQTSVWTMHYNHDSRHNNHQKLINIEWIAPVVQPADLLDDAAWHDEVRWLAGAATFKNSYDQQSTYLYGGGRYDFELGEHTRAYLKLTGGLIHGYRGKYKHKIPLNDLGVAPVILPAAGLNYRRANLEVIPFGAAGIMMNVGFYLR